MEINKISTQTDKHEYWVLIPSGVRASRTPFSVSSRILYNIYIGVYFLADVVGV